MYTTVEYIPSAAFSSFMTQIAQCCLEGDYDKDKALIAEISKLIDNSSYGKKSIMTLCVLMSLKLVQQS